jgi:two-component system chemotaxis sensor kinase CheA
MIIDPSGVADAIGSVASVAATAMEKEAPSHGADDARTSVLVFRAGSPGPKAVPLSLVTRLEEVDVGKIELSNGRHLIQYRGQLMPLVRISDQVRFKDDGTQPLLVFSDGGRSMALVVDEIVDIVDDHLNIEVAGECAGTLGSAVIKGEATEIIDVGHFMPLAFADWFRRSRGNDTPVTRHLLLVDDSDFFRNMLRPVLRAAGFEVVSVSSGADALALIGEGRRFDVIVTDIDMPGMDGIALAEAIRADARGAATPIIALSSIMSAETIARVRKAGIHDFVAKFDRQGLIASLKEQTADISRAA